MRDDVVAAIAEGKTIRQEILRPLSASQRMALLEDLFTDLFGAQHVILQKWGLLTGQSAQVDTGYIAQFVASIVLGEPGQGFRGKGDDLVDGSEVKAASIISGVDRPRWNHNLGKIADDAKRLAKKQALPSTKYLSMPHMFYLLADRPVKSRAADPDTFRIRAWCIDAQKDDAWRSAIKLYVAQRKNDQYNLQLHPPVGYDDSIVTNTIVGDLDFEDTLVFDARLDMSNRAKPSVTWHTPLAEKVVPVTGRTRALPNGQTKHPSRLSSAAILPDAHLIADEFPDLVNEEQSERLRVAAEAEIEKASS